MIRTFLALTFLISFFLCSIPIWIVLWIYGKSQPKKADLAKLRIVQWVLRVIRWFSGTKLTVIGKERIPTDEAVLYVGNHRSIFDIVFSYAQCPNVTGYISKDSMGKVPFLSTWMKQLHCLFLDRDDMKQSLKIILAAIENIKNGISMSIYPEGTRAKGENELDMLPFKEGSLKMAEKTGCKIVPMAITGSADVFEKHFPRIKKASVILEYGEPIDLQTLDAETRKKLGAYCQSKILEMLEKHQTM